jgi:hypothetical protein
MERRLLGLFTILALGISCTQKSHIDPLFEAENPFKTAIEKTQEDERLGKILNSDSEEDDPGVISVNVKVPIGEDTLDPYTEDPVASNLPVLGPMVEQMKHLFFNMAVQLGLGKLHISVPVEELPDLDIKQLKSVKIKKIFFVQDNRTCLESIKEDPSYNCSQTHFYVKPRKIEGDILVKKRLNFKFLDRIYIGIKTSEGPLPLAYNPSDSEITVVDMKKKDFFEIPKNFALDKDSEILASYWKYPEHEPEKHEEQMKKSFYVLTPYPIELKNFIQEDENYSFRVKDMAKSNGMLIIETNDYAKKMIKEMKDDIRISHFMISKYKTCEYYRCLKMNVFDKNLLPVLKNKKSASLDIYLDLDSVPRKAFWLKGFIEVEVKFKLEL